MRMRSSALPPVKAKPKPSIVWYCWSSFTSMVGAVSADSEKRRGAFWGVSNWDRSGVVSHSLTSPGSCAFADTACHDKSTHNRDKTTLGFMNPPLSTKLTLETNGCLDCYRNPANDENSE